MRPLKLVMQAFGPYPNREEVDFEYLAEAGIFLIKGPTGSGKTTIFDAMSIALYGKSTGEEDKSKGGRNSLAVWRCNQADWNTETLISFNFMANDKEYQFIRRLIPKRVNLDHVFAVNVKGEDGVFRTVIEKPTEDNLSEKAEELIGLNSSQFRQVVLLPQGKFERFLVADSKEKEAILSRLFDASQWEKYATALFDKTSERAKTLAEEKKNVEVKLQEENPSFTTLDDLAGLIADLKDEKEVLEKEHVDFCGEEKKKALEADKDIARKFEQLHKLEAEGKKLALEAEEVKCMEEQVKKAEKAETLREPIRDLEAAGKDYASRKKDADGLAGKTEGIQKAAKDAKEALELHKQNSPVDELNTEIGQLQSKKSFYEDIDHLQNALETARLNRKQKEAVYAAEKKKYDAAVKNAAECLQQSNQLETLAKDIRTKYYAEIYGEIAASLLDGEECPVCGSKEHPNLAKKSSDSVSKEMMEAAEEQAVNGKKAWEKADADRNAMEKHLHTAEAEMNSAIQAETEAETRYKNTAENLIADIRNSAELNHKIAELQKKIETYEKKTNELTADLEGKQRDWSKHEESLSTAQKEKEKAEGRYKELTTVLENALKNSGYSDAASAKKDLLSAEQRNGMREKITSYATYVEANRKQLQQQTKEVEGMAEPDANLFAAREKEIANESKEYTAKRERLAMSIDRLLKKQVDLNKAMEHYNANIQQAENDLSFAKKLRGDTGIGLQRYVLGIMFNQIINEANEMLQNVHGGRYRLFRTDEKGSGNKRGLELLVHDNRKPEENGRPVSSLSGGEKFLVSLSLSIGMSSIAQKSGLRIEALFIDEGFGTLDSSSIGDAMKILECVQKSNGMIGIISHVAVLESTIGRHLEIVKTEQGSSIRMC